MDTNWDAEAGALSVIGTADISAADALRKALSDSLAQGSALTVDLSAAVECDTAALQLLCSAHKSAEQQSKSFRVIGLTPEFTATCSALGVAMERFGAQANSNAA